MPEQMILTNVRLTPEEHRAAKQRALELGVPLSELLRHGLLRALADVPGALPAQAREAPVTYQARGRTPDTRPAPPPAVANLAERLAILDRTAGALKQAHDLAEGLGARRREPLRHPSWTGDIPTSPDTPSQRGDRP